MSINVFPILGLAHQENNKKIKGYIYPLKFEIKITVKKIEFGDYIRAMQPDLVSNVGRSRVRIDENSNYFYIYISSPDIAAMRAALSSFTRWFKVVTDIMKGVE